MIDRSAKLSEEEAQKYALDGLKDAGLDQVSPWIVPGRATRGPTEALQTLCRTRVRRLNHHDSFYYIVLVETSPGRSRVAVTVDADSGEFLETIASDDEDTDICPQLSLDEALSAAVRKLNDDYERNSSSDRVQPNQLVPAPTLVWEPCEESFSPFVPFYMFALGKQRIYVRVDGRVFPKLSVDVAGA